MKTEAYSLPLFLIALATALFMVFAACGDDDDDNDNDDGISEEDILSDDEGLKEDGIAAPPPMFIDPERPFSNSEVAVTVEAPGAVTIDLIMTGDGCGSLTNASGTTPLTLSGYAAANGSCSLSATATYAGGETEVLEGLFEVQAEYPDIPPIEVIGGVYSPAALPAPSGTAEAPVIGAVDGPTTFINGGSASFAISYTGAEEATHLAVGIAGFGGHFLLPVDGQSGMIIFEMTFDHDIFDQLTLKADAATIILELLDAVGSVSQAYNLLLNGTEVQTGEVKISLSWDTPTDVDLHVIEPSGEEIYYSNSVSSTGGTLDLDSNPGCNIDGVNNENVYWPDGASPQGDYTVTARMYSDCEVGGASGTVTMTFCGEDSPIVESFGLGATGDSESWDFTSLCGARVSGTIKYEDFALKQTGLSSTGSMVPVRYAKVQVVREDDDEVLAEGKTNSQGEYDIGFVNDDVPGYYVRLVSESNDLLLKQSVKTLDDKLYTWKTDVFDETEDPINEDADLEIEKNKEAGALNIYDVGVTSWQHAWSNSGKLLPALTFYWTDGQKPGGKNSSFATRDNKIYILGAEADPDQYDDVIIAHEYGHFVHNNISKNDSPGGPHSSNNQVAPTLAFAEGWATYFGITANKVTAYMDTKKNGAMQTYYSIETPPAKKTKGNEGGKLEGNISEAIVSAVLLDLADSSNETKDTLAKQASVFMIMTGYLQSGNSKFKDRGVEGRDLVDFLDGWFCLGYGEKGEDDKTGVRGNVVGLHELSYDFKEVTSCK